MEDNKNVAEEDVMRTDFETKAIHCPCRNKSTNACKLVDKFCDQEICAFNYWS